MSPFAEKRRSWLNQLAPLALSGVLLVFAWAIVGAVRLAPTAVPATDDGAETGRATAAAARPDSAPVPDIGVAVSRNVFSPSRRAPATAYRLSVTDPSADVAMASTVRERIDPVVLGTAMGANGTSFAMCSYEDAPAVVVRVGDLLGPYTVVAIVRGRVTFRDVDGSRLEVESPTSPDGELP